MGMSFSRRKSEIPTYAPLSHVSAVQLGQSACHPMFSIEKFNRRLAAEGTTQRYGILSAYPAQKKKISYSICADDRDGIFFRDLSADFGYMQSAPTSPSEIRSDDMKGVGLFF